MRSDIPSILDYAAVELCAGKIGHIYKSSLRFKSRLRALWNEDAGIHRYCHAMWRALASLVHQFASTSVPRMISVLDLSESLNANAFSPIRMETSEGKSIRSGRGEEVTLEHSARTILECPCTKLEGFEFEQVYS